MYAVVHVELDFEVENTQILQPGIGTQSLCACKFLDVFCLSVSGSMSHVCVCVCVCVSVWLFVCVCVFVCVSGCVCLSVCGHL